MNRSELAAAVARATGTSLADATHLLSTMLEEIETSLARGEEVRISGFGTFEVRSRRARSGRNPRTGAAIEIPEANVPAFRAGKAFKEAVLSEPDDER